MPPRMHPATNQHRWSDHPFGWRSVSEIILAVVPSGITRWVLAVRRRMRLRWWRAQSDPSIVSVCGLFVGHRVLTAFQFSVRLIAPNATRVNNLRIALSNAASRRLCR